MSQKDGDQMTIMEAWQQTSPWGGWNTIQPMVRPMEEVATLFLLEIFVKTMKI